MVSDVLIDNPDGENTLILAHGAGSPMDSPFMETFASGLAAAGLRVVRFEFPYMAERRHGGKKRPPNGMAVLEQCWRDIYASHRAGVTFIGGKSMGGRIASHVADDLGVAGLICLGYPFHPPYKPEKLRVAHLEGLKTRTLIVQGTRDKFGSPEDVGSYSLSDSIRVRWIDSGDHSFTPTVASGLTPDAALEQAVDYAVEFVEGS